MHCAQKQNKCTDFKSLNSDFTMDFVSFIEFEDFILKQSILMLSNPNPFVCGWGFRLMIYINLLFPSYWRVKNCFFFMQILNAHSVSFALKFIQFHMLSICCSSHKLLNEICSHKFKTTDFFRCNKSTRSTVHHTETRIMCTFFYCFYLKSSSHRLIRCIRIKKEKRKKIPTECRGNLLQ